MTLLLAAITLLPASTPDSADAIKLVTPAIKMRSNVAGATRSPWVDSNGWRLARHAGSRFVYNAPGKSAALAYAEAFIHGADAYIQTDAEGVEHFARMEKFCAPLETKGMNAAANIGVIDDGSASSGEILNLLVRRNLLFKILEKPDSKLDLNVTLATYPNGEKDPSALAQRIRGELGDDKRLVRIYGSEVVIARLLTGGGKVRLYLLNYSSRPVEGIRVRVAGEWPKHAIRIYSLSDARTLDYTTNAGATEFTIAELPAFSVIDLEK